MRTALKVAGATVAVIGLMIAAGATASAVFPSDWRPVEAAVARARIESRRLGGPPEWALVVDASYTVDGRRYRPEGLIVFRNDDRGPVEEERRDWPPGRRFSVYVDDADHRSVSLYADGGRGAVSATFAILVPVLLAAGFFTWSLVSAFRSARRTS